MTETQAHLVLHKARWVRAVDIFGRVQDRQVFVPNEPYIFECRRTFTLAAIEYLDEWEQPIVSINPFDGLPVVCVGDSIYFGNLGK